MKIVERADLNVELWDELVRNSLDSTIFSLSIYLDAVAENWCVYVDEKYTKGIALPYTLRLNVKTLYTPTLLMYVEWFGKEIPSGLIEKLKSAFTIGNFCMKERMDDLSCKEYLRQEIVEPHFNEQAKRALKRFEKSSLVLSKGNYENEVLVIIEKELPIKIASLDKAAIISLKKLVQVLVKEDLLLVHAVVEKQRVVGGILSMKFKNRTIYLKGAFEAEAKKNGGMFKCISTLIEEEKLSGRIVDFGGSRIENVRKFNLNFGAVDRTYYNFTWNNAPLHFKLLKRLKKAIK